MPTINQTASSSSLFVLNGKEYSKGNYLVYYNKLITDNLGNIDEDSIQVGLKYKGRNEELQAATHWSEWVNDESGLPFGSRSELLTYLAPILNSGSSTSTSPVTDVNLVSPSVLNVSVNNPESVIPDIVNYFYNPGDPGRPIREVLEPNGDITYIYIDDNTTVPALDIPNLQPWYPQAIDLINDNIENLIGDFNALKSQISESEVNNEFFLSTDNINSNIQDKVNQITGSEVDIITGYIIFLGNNGSYNGVIQSDGDVISLEQYSNNRLILDKDIVVPTTLGLDPSGRVGVLINVNYKV